MLDVPPDHPMAREGANADGRVRTAGDWQVPPEMALKFLEQGNLGPFQRSSPPDTLIISNHIHPTVCVSVGSTLLSSYCRNQMNSVSMRELSCVQ